MEKNKIVCKKCLSEVERSEDKSYDFYCPSCNKFIYEFNAIEEKEYNGCELLNGKVSEILNAIRKTIHSNENFHEYHDVIKHAFEVMKECTSVYELESCYARNVMLYKDENNNKMCVKIDDGNSYLIIDVAEDFDSYINDIVEPRGVEMTKEVNDGGKNSYYDIDVSDIDTIDVDDISEKYGFNPYEFNIFKALVGTANQRNYGKSRHKASSDDKLRDYNKALYYANKNLLYGMKIYK